MRVTMRSMVFSLALVAGPRGASYRGMGSSLAGKLVLEAGGGIAD
jgi:hypothetical protein